MLSRIIKNILRNMNRERERVQSSFIKKQIFANPVTMKLIILIPYLIAMLTYIKT